MSPRSSSQTKCVFTLAVLAVLLSVSFSARAAEPRADLFVAPGGNDGWSGRAAEANDAQTDGPLATFHRAQQAVRELKQQQQPDRDRPIVVAIRGGTYYLQKPITFGPEDSGSKKAPVIYRAYRDERPVFSRTL